MKTPILLLLIFLSTNVRAEDEKKVNLTFGGFIDTFYAFDFNRPQSVERNFGGPNNLVTTAGRHNEFNLNLAVIDARVSAEHLRGRVALQTGTSVEANYAGETNNPNGQNSMGSLLRNIQEAYVGYQIADNLWLDAGIYLSHIGLESFPSRDNWTYTRSFLAENSPYYQAGVKLTYQATPQWAFQFHVLNGWQNIIETNANKALGTQVAYTPNQTLSFTWNTFLGEEEGDRTRFFNDFIAKVILTDKVQVAATADVGLQQKASSGNSTWYGMALFVRYQIDPKLSVTGRIERYSDPDRIIVRPSNPLTSLVANSASINLDYELYKNLLWRNELRGYWASDPVFSKQTDFGKQDALVVSSLAFSF